MKTKNSKGGWSFTGFSNAEAFAIQATNGFAHAFKSANMENAGTYAGNAKNHMIYSFGNDKKYIERGNFSFIVSHGSPTDGPNVEHMPLNNKSWNLVEWGEAGRLQWVGMTGCDILGFPTYPDGTIAFDCWPRPERWNGIFQGVSGILGYRSGSYYQANNLNLAKSTGEVLSHELTSGATFFDAWISMADYLHRRLDQMAEVAVFASSTDSLSDSLTSFVPERNLGLDLLSIRRAMVGRSRPAHYNYCERVDERGNQLCIEPFDDESYIEIAPGLWRAPSISPKTLELPEFNTVPAKHNPLLAKKRQLNNKSTRLHQLNELTTIDFDIDEKTVFQFLMESIDSASTCRLLSERTGTNSQSASRSINISGVDIPLFGDFGATYTHTALGSRLRYSAHIYTTDELPSIKITIDDSSLAQRLEKFTAPDRKVYIDDLRTVYSSESQNNQQLVTPKLCVYMRIQIFNNTMCLVELI